MKILVTYQSITGNTKKMAEAINSSLTGEVIIKRISDVESTSEYDLIFLGFPIMEFGIKQNIKDFIKTIQDKKIVLFISHAMPNNHPILEKIFKNCLELIPGENLIDILNCRGELSESVSKALLNSESKELQEFGKMRETTVGYPTNSDLEELKELSKKSLGRVSL